MQKLSISCYISGHFLKERRHFDASLLEAPGIWYKNDFAEFLCLLGDQVVHIPGEEAKPAKEIYEEWKTKGFLHIRKAPQEYWESRDHGNTIALKPGKLASDALKSLIKGVSLLDCTIFIKIATLKALKKILGEEEFNKLADLFPSFVVTLHENQDWLLTLIGDIEDVAPDDSGIRLAPGHFFYIHGVIGYLDKHECGNGSGMNLIYLGGGKFIGLGTNPLGMTIKELYSLLVDEYNKKPIPRELLYSKENLSLHDDVILKRPGKEDLVMSFEEFQKVLAHEQKLYEEGALPEAPSEQTVRYVEEKLKRKAKQKELADHQISLQEFENSLPKIVQASAPFLGLTKLRQLHDKLKKAI